MKFFLSQVGRIGYLLVPVISVPVVFASDALEEIVVVSTRLPTPAITQGTSFSILNQQRLLDQGYDSIAQQLSTQVGVSVTRNGGIGSVTTVRIRGEEGYRTQLIMDGLRVADSTAPQVTPVFDDLMSDGVERVEILRGPQGMIYGADAGGVVSVSSKTFSDGFGGSVDIKTGQNGYQRAGASVGAGGTKGHLGLFASSLQSSGYNVYELDTSGERDGYDNRSVHINGELNLNESWQVGIVSRYHQADNEYDDCGFSSPINNCDTESSLAATLVTLGFSGEQSQQKVSYSKTEIARDFYSDGFFSYGYEGDIERANYLGASQVSDNSSVIYGLDYEKQTSGTDERSQTGYHLALQSRWQRLHYHLGARVDDNEEFGQIATFRLSSNLALFANDRGQLHLKMALGDGFRAPSLFENEYNHAWAAPGTDALSEERTLGGDIGLQWYASSGLTSSITWFRQVIEDAIVFDLQSFAYAQVEGDSESTGVEFEITWPASEILEVSANYTYNQTESVDGQPRPRRPKQIANVGVVLTPIEHLRLFTNLRLVQDSEDFDGTTLDDYELLDLTLRYQITSGLDFYINVENVLDESFQQARYYRAPGRQSFAGIQWQF